MKIENCANRIKTALNSKNMTASELCKKTGIPKSAMSQYINGKFEPKQHRIFLISHALDVSEAWLMGYDVQETSIELSIKEKKLITAYREQPQMQNAVDKLLNIE